ncbi:MAG: cellulose synthase complex periplasmic endoglucanase BcsZ [Thiotrichales bacterium]
MPRSLLNARRRVWIGAIVAPMLALQAQACPPPSAHWEAYVKYFLQHDGRVVEFSQKSRSTSEAQAYALFHALVANDRARFAKVLEWAENNLAQGALTRELMAWKWGYRENDRQWGVIDANPASDADAWLAYSLLEAGRLWSEPRYTSLGRHVLRNIEAALVADLPGLGPMLLPGPWSHDPQRNIWKLNPSYLPLQVLRRFQVEHADGPWERVLDNAARMLRDTARAGVVPDWIEYKPGEGFMESNPEQGYSSYDAIRVYLWIGMLNKDEPQRAPLLSALQPGFCIGDTPPERVHLPTRTPEGEGPVGFKAALLPYLSALDNQRCLKRLLADIEANWNDDLLTEEPVYYDQNLALFGLGWFEHRYHFDAKGHLHTQWETTCRDSNSASSHSG